MAELSTLARPYARAFFELQHEAGTLAAGQSAVDAMAAVVSEEQVARLIGHPAVSKEELVALVQGASGDALSDDGLKLLKVLADNKRVALLPAIAEQYGLLKDEAERRIAVDMTAAKPVSDDAQAALVAALSKRLGRDVELSVTIDDALIGGAVLRAGDLVIDGSVAGRVDRITQALTA
ncbi:F0F1 ATP synthase subunit delta [Abyssibacter profundi]|uniref:ATP synthase subunit delta n=1 Tax=Abyssibacter profundi TaxID=2182787 RepID=A0A363UJD5_9GAMM|nr:F0F1 ATP synthase subunit delta [Abyssibacter profundi]MBV62339.1 F0F1 ATP synthase subunit delta [Nevskiales bacterium]PWN55531.1 F0F1 ATP synthase subunit delta [Abyssibacter profundi]